MYLSCESAGIFIFLNAGHNNSITSGTIASLTATLTATSSFGHKSRAPAEWLDIYGCCKLEHCSAPCAVVINNVAGAGDSEEAIVG